ncbi:MAG: YvcK family protein [Anaerolineae bacterium]|nr:YvcK family protein [Anaerolineae bacterium]
MAPMSSKVSQSKWRVWLNESKWLYIGLGFKRWLVLLFLGIGLVVIGWTLLLVDWLAPIQHPVLFPTLGVQLFDRNVRGVVIGAMGMALVVLSLARLSRTIVSAFAAPETSFVEALYRKRMRQQGPRIVALGGGTGLATLLRGLKEYTTQLTAVVTVADDGGSSGRLRREFGVLPPGDFRQCVAALAEAEPLMTLLLQYRFGHGAGLEGHAFGNLLIVAMSNITGSFESALRELSRVLAVRGRVLPSTLHPVTLCAEKQTPHLERVTGESAIPKRDGHIARVYLEPEDAPAYPEVVRAILEADLIIAGPGSLYTSVLPNLLVPDIQSALRASSAVKVYVCNIATQPGETDHFSVEDHIYALEQHIGTGIFTHVIANNNFDANLNTRISEWVKPRESASNGHTIIFADVVDQAQPWRHDPVKLAQVILRWYNEYSATMSHKI